MVAKQSKVSGRVIYAATILALAALMGGFALASFTITSGSETANGNYTSATALTYWTQTSTGIGTASTTATAASTTVGSPTVLSALAATYAINTQTANDNAQKFVFSETTAAPTSTEIEISFTVSLGSTPTFTTVTVYMETQVTAPLTALTFTFLYDIGSASGGTITINSVEQVSQQCSAVGTCP